MFPRFAPAIGLLAALVPGIVPVSAHAQTNIDQGKSPAQIFAQDCAACHKATRGLANGKNSLSLTLFLREHYTTSRDQAAALAAYVLGAGGAEAAKPGQKPGQERARIEEAKPGEPKTAARPGRPAGRPEPEPSGSAKREQQASHPAAAEHEPHGPAAAHDRKPEPPTAAPQPATVVSAPPASETPAAEPAKTEPAKTEPAKTEPAKTEPAKTEPKIETEAAPRPEPGQDQTPTTRAAAPAEAQPGDGAPVPRDNIPD